MSVKRQLGGPSAEVPKDPQPTVDRIDELARRILSGDILLPKFQRGFVWDRGQILQLWDSVARGYPIGGILLWQSRQELRSENRIAGLNINLPRPDYPVNYLLDGQQRLSTICGALFWDGSAGDNRWNIVYDLRLERFSHLDPSTEPSIHQIRVNKLADPAAYFQHVSVLDSESPQDGSTLKDRAERLFRRFKDYKIATVTLGDMSIDDVAPIFERINSTGTRLTIVDLMRAATWSPEFDLVDSIEEILEDLQIKGFGEIDKKTVLRTISASAGGGFSRSSIDGLRNFDVESLRSAVDTTRESYRMTVDYLSTQLRIPYSAVLPYQNQMVVLAEFFRLIPRPTATQYKALDRWFWRTAGTGYFGGWNTGQMASDQQSIADFAANEPSDIAVDLDDLAPGIWRSRTFRRNTAHAKLLAILLSKQQPLDLLTGQLIDVERALSWVNSREFHHFFPRDFLRNQGCTNNESNRLGNIILLTSSSNKRISNRAPSDYLSDVEEAAGEDFASWRQRSLISDDAYLAALDDDYDLFLEARAETIHEALKGLTELD